MQYFREPARGDAAAGSSIGAFPTWPGAVHLTHPRLRTDECFSHCEPHRDELHRVHQPHGLAPGMPKRRAKPQTVVVTGATGFLGRALCERLHSDHVLVRAAARNPAAGPWSDFVPLDLPSSVPPELFAGVDVVYHLAGRAHMSVSLNDATVLDEVNRRGTEESARSAQAHHVKRFVFMSTVKALGEPGKAIVREDQASTAMDPYGGANTPRNSRSSAFTLPTFRSWSFGRRWLRPWSKGESGELAKVRARRPSSPSASS